MQGAGSGRHDHNLYGKLLWKAVADTAALSLSLSPPASSHMLIGINNGLSRSSRAVGGGECWSGAVAVFGCVRGRCMEILGNAAASFCFP